MPAQRPPNPAKAARLGTGQGAALDPPEVQAPLDTMFPNARGSALDPLGLTPAQTGAKKRPPLRNLLAILVPLSSWYKPKTGYSVY